MNDAPHEVRLPGCTPEPLMAYLKALGILRLVSEQKDSAARGFWKDDLFWLRSTLDPDALVTFFLEEYSPTPIVAPWAGGSGFFKKDNQKAVEALRNSRSSRVRPYAGVIESVHAIIEDERIGDKPRDEEKARLIRRYRRELPDNVIAWMDTAMVIQGDGQAFAPLLGTGGNDGRLDFTQNFMQRVVALGLHKDGPVDDASRAQLNQALFMTPAILNNASVGQFAPGGAGGPNATQGMEGDPIDNPWSFILMIEGALMLGGATSRRFGVSQTTRASFPFTVRAVAAGFDSPAQKEAGSRGELWLPLWSRPTHVSELSSLFGEGRAEVSGRPARNGTDFARAAASLAVDRGISEFRRIGFLRRSGKNFLATPLGRHVVAERTGVDLLREIDPWFDRFRRAVGDKDAPPRFGSVLRCIDLAIFEFCKYGGASFFQNIVIALGAAERELRSAERFRDKHKINPLAKLSSDWIEAANDGSQEFAVARALAGIHDPEGKIGPLRAHLEPVDWRARCGKWAEKDRAVVWNSAELPTNMAHVLQRRLMDGARAGCEHQPLDSLATVSLETVSAFLDEQLDDRRIEDLLWGLMLTERVGHHNMPVLKPDRPVSRAYALLKWLFLPRPLLVKNEEIAVRPEPAVLHRLRAGRLGEACTIAMRRLRASGLQPMPGPIRGHGVRDDNWRELDNMGIAGIDPMRLAAALLIPINKNAVKTLGDLVICGSDEE